MAADLRPGCTANGAAPNATTLVLDEALMASTPQANDILIAQIEVRNNPTITAPDGTWTQIDTQSTANGRVSTFWKRRGAGAATSYSFGIGASNNACWILDAYMGVITTGSPLTPATDGLCSDTTSGTTITLASITTTVDGALIIAAVATAGNTGTYGTYTATAPATLGNAVNVSQSTNSSLGRAYGNQVSQGATGVVSVIATVSGNRLGMVFGLIPAPVVAGRKALLGVG